MQEVIDKELFILGQQVVYHEFDITNEMLYTFRDKYGNDLIWALYKSYNYGFIQGKRAERRRRKK